MTRSPIIEYIIQNNYVLIQTDFLREIWMIPQRHEADFLNESSEGSHFTFQTHSPLYKGKLFLFDGHFWGVTQFTRIDDRQDDHQTYHLTATNTYIPGDHLSQTPLCTPQDSFTLTNKDIINYQGDPIDTSLGIYIANYLFLVYPFDDVIPYLNEEFTDSKLEKRITQPLLEGKITVAQVKDRYINTLTLMGQSNDMICPGISEKTITIPQSIKDLRIKLVHDNQAALEAGDASVMSDIEHQLVQAYKNHLKGDSSLHFLLKKSTFDVKLKKLFLTGGMTEEFGSPGKFDFVAQPVGEGWLMKDMPTIFNEVRAGSYSRAKETANGGVIAKLFLRVLQDTRIDADDCGTIHGEYVEGTEHTLKDFMWSYIINHDGTTTLITDKNWRDYLGKDIVIRTPGYCQQPHNYCKKCFGSIFEKLGYNAFAPIANGFSKTITTAALKKMHGISHLTVDLTNINKYIIR